MSEPSYAFAADGLPPQSRLMTGRAVFTEAYAVLPRGTQTAIVTSRLPGWQGTRLWVLARPLSGFAETFAHYLMEVAPGGGSSAPEPDPAAQAALFVTAGRLRLDLAGAAHHLGAGDFAWLPPGAAWQLAAEGDTPARFHWIRKRWQPAAGLAPPGPVFASDAGTPPEPMPDCGGVWATTRFTDPEDLRHDMAVTVVTFAPGGTIPFEETHVMEHGLYVLEGKAVYKLNRDWVEVEAGDYMWLRAFCPQACYAGGPGPFRYLLYKDVNRHMPLGGHLGHLGHLGQPGSAG
ncbi:bifunctional allantoicase/(S)-ureidoglycine aminohydrolase [Paralimibaculum aggregatum]|uniref:Bifunctional allantoicase/(S)-ureidoglycine aminohydrolase n=1 Tax=Paralimibaculum aggregatum TaxID=3036245 RepID=A0ABQ6LRY3_9RHOB|nr:bifunctional allantoicase/(S)-ureidoglycine aminohydrolase [Limibaculum sp. NKW23]GMG84306.1 bifunctional allantoicase/(S)-ureidoglycine aminohydrolase [Limibaculum sp. NKW23]